MPKKTRTLLVLGALALLITFGALAFLRAENLANDPTRETTAKIAQALEAGGVAVDRIEESGGAFSAQKSATFFTRGELITAFLYDSPEEALTIARQFSGDAQTLAGTPIEWVAPPHLYLRHNAMILYIGSSPPLINVLNQTFGNQFAGS